jgi:hypothetical protein
MKAESPCSTEKRPHFARRQGAKLTKSHTAPAYDYYTATIHQNAVFSSIQCLTFFVCCGTMVSIFY